MNPETVHTVVVPVGLGGKTRPYVTDPAPTVLIDLGLGEDPTAETKHEARAAALAEATEAAAGLVADAERAAGQIVAGAETQAATVLAQAHSAAEAERAMAETTADDIVTEARTAADAAITVAQSEAAEIRQLAERDAAGVRADLEAAAAELETREAELEARAAALETLQGDLEARFARVDEEADDAAAVLAAARKDADALLDEARQAADSILADAMREASEAAARLLAEAREQPQHTEPTDRIDEMERIHRIEMEVLRGRETRLLDQIAELERRLEFVDRIVVSDVAVPPTVPEPAPEPPPRHLRAVDDEFEDTVEPAFTEEKPARRTVEAASARQSAPAPYAPLTEQLSPTAFRTDKKGRRRR